MGFQRWKYQVFGLDLSIIETPCLQLTIYDG